LSEYWQGGLVNTFIIYWKNYGVSTLKQSVFLELSFFIQRTAPKSGMKGTQAVQ
jgi:hypothetical protein